MAEQIRALVVGGKATAGPPLGPALGPLGVPVGQVIAKINEKTKQFDGMQVPVTVRVNPKTRAFDVEVGTPPVSALIKKELKLEKGSGNPKSEKVANMAMEQAIKIAMMKESAMTSRSRRGAVKTVIGTCVSMGVMVEGKDPKDIMADLDSGFFDEKIIAGKTELSAEELARIEAEKTRLADESKKAHEIEEAKAKEILEKMAGKERSEIKMAMKTIGISTALINKLLPVDTGETKPGAAGAAAPAAGGTAKAAAPAAKKEEKK